MEMAKKKKYFMKYNASEVYRSWLRALG